MRQETIRALNAINSRFYTEHADEFDDTRRGPWKGWRKLVDPVRALTGSRVTPELRVLDLGCGNGRFAGFLADHVGELRYTGVDCSPGLLRCAARCQPGARLIEHDLVDRSFPTVDEPFDLVAAIALLHHVPSYERRVALLRDAADTLAPTGLAIVTHWQFLAEPSLARRAFLPDEPSDLEDGDRILRWGAESTSEDSIRYCHHTSDDEAGRLALAAGLEIVDAFHADGRNGRLNLYQILRRSAASHRPAGQ